MGRREDIHHQNKETRDAFDATGLEWKGSIDSKEKGEDEGRNLERTT